MHRLCCAALALGFLCSAKPSWEFDSHGNVVLGGDLAGIRAVVNMHGPNWSNATAMGITASERTATSAAGALDAPAGCQGKLDFSVEVRPVGDAVELAYALHFTEPTTITGAYVSLFLPVDRQIGQQVALLRSKSAGTFTEDIQGTVVSGQAPGLFIGGEDGLAVAMNAVGPVMVQDGRKYHSTEYELRFALFGNGPVRPGLEARRVFRLARTSAKEAEAMVAELNPPRELRDGQPYLLLEEDGTLQVRDARRRQLVDILLAAHGPNWSYVSQGGKKVATVGDDRSRSLAGSLEIPQNPAGTVLDFAETVSETGPQQARLAYQLSFPKGATLNGYQASFTVPLRVYSGKSFTIVADGQPGQPTVIPATLGESFLFNGEARGFALATGEAESLRVVAQEPMRLLVQDNRGWGGDSIEFRFCFARIGQQDGQAASVPVGYQTGVTYDIALPTDTQIVLNQAASPSRTDTHDWIPYTLPWDSAPVDVSFLNAKPAGSEGFVTVRDGRFVLADSGREIRFWGTCFSAGSNFPSHEQAEKIARRLASFGINMVRTHHADASWAERHFFPKEVDDTRHFDAENLDRFDYLMYCLERAGIYIYLDQLVNRSFKTGDEVDAVDQIGVCGKPYSNFDPRLIELQKEFSRNIWTHVNPYTKRAYKDDPAVALMEFANENDLFTQTVTVEPYRTRLEARYRAWAAEQGVTLPKEPVDFTKSTDSLMRFLIEVQANYYAEMGKYLREEVGVRVPMTGSNWSRNAALLLSLDALPYTDSHAYHNHPSREGVFGNTPMLGGSGTIMDGLGFQARVGKPFFVSEWDEPWPNEWRAELPLWIAAVSAFQGWNGLTVYTYRHSSAVPVDSITGAFETFNDPARFGLFPHAALIYRRGDFSEGKETTVVRVPRAVAESAKSPSPWSSRAYRGLAESQRFRTDFATGLPYDQPIVEGDKRESTTGQIRHDIERRLLLLDSPRTQAISGFLKEVGTVQTSGLTVTGTSLFATVAASALDDQELARSGRVLLTAVGRAENTDFAYNLLRNRRVSSGSGPILADPIRAQVALRTSQTNLQVVPVAADGSQGKPLPSRYADGTLQFEIGPAAKTIYYLIEAR